MHKIKSILLTRHVLGSLVGVSHQRKSPHRQEKPMKPTDGVSVTFFIMLINKIKQMINWYYW